MATEPTTPPCDVEPSDPFLALWLDLWMLRQEFEHRRFGTPDYDLTHDHAYEVLTVALERVEQMDRMMDQRP